MKKALVSCLLFILAIGGCVSCQQTRTASATKDGNVLSGLRIAILLTDGFEQIEMTGPRKALDDAGAKTVLISPKDRVQGYHGDQKAEDFKVDRALSDARAEDFDALVLPGGVKNPDSLRLVPEAIEFIKKMGNAKKPIAAICHGPWTLINAGLVKGHTVTSWPSLKVDLENAGAIWVDKEVVVSGNLITSRKPDDIPAFNDAMLKLFKKEKP